MISHIFTIKKFCLPKGKKRRASSNGRTAHARVEIKGGGSQFEKEGRL
jgi:hypothetical protein